MTPTSDAALEILKQDRLGRVRTPLARQEAILEELERSGMSGQQFAQHLGIKYQTFAMWVQKRRKREAGDLVEANKPALRWVEAECYCFFSGRIFGRIEGSVDSFAPAHLALRAACGSLPRGSPASGGVGILGKWP